MLIGNGHNPEAMNHLCASIHVQPGLFGCTCKFGFCFQLQARSIRKTTTASYIQSENGVFLSYLRDAISKF